MLRDFRYAYRVLKKSLLATTVMIAALALGIGANAGSFVSINAIVLHPFPYPKVDRIMTVWETMPKLGIRRGGFASANFTDLKEQNRSFARLAAYRPWTVNITGGDRPERVDAVKVTQEFFQVFGATAKVGRTFADNVSEPGADRVAVLSESLWHTRFASRPDIAGQTISLGGQNYSIVGVMPDDFDYPLATEVWVPLTFTAAEKTDRDFRDLLVVGLLKPDAGIPRAAAEIQAIAQRLGQQYPETNADWSAAVTPLRQMTEETTNQFIRVLMVASLFLLLLAAANVANIQLARATSRVKALAIEAALGAGRWRLARSLCAETILVAVSGGAIGLVAANWWNSVGRRSIPAVVYHWVPGLRYSRVDATVVVFTLVVSLLTGILCSLPAIAHLLGKNSSSVLGEVLSQGSRAVAGSRRSRLRNALVVSEVAMALLLLVGAGAMINTLQHMLSLNLGFNPSNLLTAEIALPKKDYPENEPISRFFDRVLPEVAGIPGVKRASMEGGMGEAVGFQVEGRNELIKTEQKPDIRVVGPDYFDAMQLRMIRGRAILDADAPSSSPVIVISESVARRYFEGSDPIGRRIHFNSGNQPPWYTVVGTCADTINWFTNQGEPAIYISYRQVPRLALVERTSRLLLRTAGDPSLAAAALIARVRSADPAEPVYQIKTMEETFDEQRSGVQAATNVMMSNALIALFLAVTGIYGVVSYFVNQRTKEIGIRIALGAAPRGILKMTLGEAGRVVMIGLAVGVPAAYLLMRVLSSALYNVVIVRWTTFSAVTLLLTAAALLAAYLPARRAAKVDPIIALRTD
jgi:putative ABC transport system permease protein